MTSAGYKTPPLWDDGKSFEKWKSEIENLKFIPVYKLCWFSKKSLYVASNKTAGNIGTEQIVHLNIKK